MNWPATSVPIDDPRLAVVTYQTKTSARVVGSVSSESDDSSMARNGPKSPPVADMTPGDGRDEKNPVVLRQGEGSAGEDHQDGTDEESTTPADSVGDQGEEQRWKTSPTSVSVMNSPMWASRHVDLGEKSARINEQAPYENMRQHRRG